MTPSGQIPLAFDHRPSLSGEDFLIAPCNRAAVGWVDRWPDWTAPVLVIFGPAGCGKTHLGQVFLEKTGGQALAAAEIRGRRVPRGADGGSTFLLDDAETALGAGGEEALFHLYNALQGTGGHVLLTASRPPAQWDFGLKDLASRLRAAPAAGIKPPDDDLLGMLLLKLFSDRQLKVDMDVIAYMIPRMERTFDAARSLVDVVDQAALAERRNITVPLMRDVIERLNRI